MRWLGFIVCLIIIKIKKTHNAIISFTAMAAVAAAAHMVTLQWEFHGSAPATHMILSLLLLLYVPLAHTCLFSHFPVALSPCVRYCCTRWKNRENVHIGNEQTINHRTLGIVIYSTDSKKAFKWH